MIKQGQHDKSLPLFISLQVITINSGCFIYYNRTHGNVILGPHDVCICFPPKFQSLDQKYTQYALTLIKRKSKIIFGILNFIFKEHRIMRSIITFILHPSHM